MERINIKKVDLLKKLKSNLIIHEKIFKESKIIFKKNYLLLLRERIKEGKKNKFEFHISLQIPRNYAQAYKDAIKMVEFDCRDIIILSEEEFKKYILNKWGWIESFKTSYYSNMTYYNGSGYSGTSGSSGTSGTSSKVLKEYFGEDDGD